MRRFAILALFGLAACGGPQTGTGFKSYDTGSSTARVSTSSTIPTYAVKSGIGGNSKTTSAIMSAGLDRKSGAAFDAADISGSLKLVKTKGNTYGLVDQIRPYGGATRFSDLELANAMTSEISRRTGCSLQGSPLVSRDRAAISQLAVRLSC